MNQPKKFLDESLIAQIKTIQLRAKHLVNNSFAGNYQSAFKGRGIEFDEIREYQIGDDVRSIDWNVSARMGSPYVKIFRDERELTVMFVVDVSASSRFGTQKKFKHEIAAEITALLAYTALINNDKVGLIIFSDHVEHYVPPRKGRGHVWQLIRDILTYQSNAKRTDLNLPLQFLNRVIKHKAITFLLSDFQEEGHEQQLRVTSHRHDLIAISIQDPREMTLPDVGYIELEDAETGEFLLINTSDRHIRQQFSQHTTELARQRRDFFRANAIDHIELNTANPYIEPIISFFKSRDQRR